MCNNIYNFTVTTIDEKQKSLSDYKGKALLIVNVASYCGFTPQYKQLQELYWKFSERGFHVLGFPCNQFGKQEPGNEKEIKDFCQLNYDVTFPLFSKIHVNGKKTHPLFRFLKKEKPGILGLTGIKWNFTKFLIDRNGIVIGRFGPKVNPESLRKKILELLSM